MHAAVHGEYRRATDVGQKRSEPVTVVQHTLTFFRNLQRIKPPQPAPDKLVRQCKTARQAMRVALKAKGMKRLVCARMLDISESYLCRLVNERQPMPEWFVPAFCWATGSTLLEQWLDRQDDSEAAEEARLADLLRPAA
jgi:hypothetical protein